MVLIGSVNSENLHTHTHGVGVGVGVGVELNKVELKAELATNWSNYC